VALYVATCVLAFALLRLVLPLAPSLIAGALFAVHPVHVEAVANVVGQAELIAAAAMLSACVVFARARREGRLTTAQIALIGALFGIACLAKEHALLLPVLLALIELVVTADRAEPVSPRARLVTLIPLGISLALVGATFLVARTLTLHELLGEKPLVPVVGAQRVLVMFAVAPHWIRLFFWPAHLSADYSPHHILVPTSVNTAAVLGITIVVGTGALYWALGRGTPIHSQTRRVARLAIAWTAVTLLPVSNLFSVMLVAERTLLVPSLGAMMLIGVAISAALAKSAEPRGALIARRVFVGVTSVVVMLGLYRSRERQQVWRDDKTLFAQTVLDAPDSYRAQLFYGQWLFETGQRREGERHLRLAIRLNPTRADVSPLNYLATQYRDAGMCPAALPLYEQAIANDSGRPDVRYGLAACLVTTGRVADGKRLAQDGVRRGELRGLFEGLVAHADSLGTPGR
jgi:hypothetical protein